MSAQVKKKLKRLPKSNNGTRRKTATLGCYSYQKDALRREAAKHGMTVSYYLNYMLWKETLK